MNKITRMQIYTGDGRKRKSRSSGLDIVVYKKNSLGEEFSTLYENVSWETSWRLSTLSHKFVCTFVRSSFFLWNKRK